MNFNLHSEEAAAALKPTDKSEPFCPECGSYWKVKDNKALQLPKITKVLSTVARQARESAQYLPIQYALGHEADDKYQEAFRTLPWIPDTGSAEGSVVARTKKTTEKSTAKEKMLFSEAGYLSGNESYHDNNSEKRGAPATLISALCGE
ncbi:hypothetical protein FDENT_9660 [Fusarium denticulatum]|uniref:Uncharacterized protein n=1 Tax=Fusarium denticulatum TaxID=48507 RepID=A0A8H5WZI5_9HYPO|nr:hypothetical protein FDENT_9660 [Fusarium denticulatum]